MAEGPVLPRGLSPRGVCAAPPGDTCASGPGPALGPAALSSAKGFDVFEKSFQSPHRKE